MKLADIIAEDTPTGTAGAIAGIDKKLMLTQRKKAKKMKLNELIAEATGQVDEAGGVVNDSELIKLAKSYLLTMGFKKFSKVNTGVDTFQTIVKSEAYKSGVKFVDNQYKKYNVEVKIGMYEGLVELQFHAKWTYVNGGSNGMQYSMSTMDGGKWVPKTINELL